MSWADELQPASFRGIPFGVKTSESEFGRRHAEHEYPFRDKPWIEDLGRGTRRISLTGFIVADDVKTGEADVIGLKERLIAAAEQKGEGTLVHPTLGSMTVHCRTLSVRERWDEGRCFELGFVFIEPGERLFPSEDSAGGAVSDAAEGLDDASGETYAATMGGLFDAGASVLTRVSDVLGGFADAAVALIDDAASLISLAVTLTGNFGRYYGGRVVGFAGRSRFVATGTSTLASLIYASLASRETAREAADALRAVSPADPAAVAAAAKAALASFLEALANPADRVRLTALLAQADISEVSTSSPVGIATAEAGVATNALLRRASLAAMVRASIDYEPWSKDDALTLRNVIAAALATEITVAGDAAEDEVYGALRAARSAVIADLNLRGAALPAMQTFQFAGSLPSLALAQRLYRDPSREEELVFEADPVHPAFMPSRFTALAN